MNTAVDASSTGDRLTTVAQLPGARVMRAPSSALTGLAQLFAQRHAEAAALARVLQVRLSLGLLLVGDRLLARQPDAAAPLLDGQHEHLHLTAGRERLARIGAAGGAQLG